MRKVLRRGRRRAAPQGGVLHLHGYRRVPRQQLPSARAATGLREYKLFIAKSSSGSINMN